MKKIILLVALGVFAGCSGSSSSNGNTPVQPKQFGPPIKNAHPGVGSITVMGDSLAAGYGATDRAVVPAGCLAQLQNTEIKNVATPGFTTDQISQTIYDVWSVNPKLVFVSSGGNDTMIDDKYPGQYPKEKTLKEMNDLFDKLFMDKRVVAYLALAPPTPYATRLPEIANLAISKGVIIVDGMNGLWTDPAMMSDRIHPNNAGYSVMCNRILTAIKPYYP